MIYINIIAINLLENLAIYFMKNCNSFILNNILYILEAFLCMIVCTLRYGCIILKHFEHLLHFNLNLLWLFDSISMYN